jgi:PLP dependent protein
MDLTVRIASAVTAVRNEITVACARVGRDPQGVRLIAVTKNQGSEVLAPLIAAGIHNIGENRLEHHREMHAAAKAGGLELAIHAIGRVQGRQLAKLAPLSACLHSLCEEEHILRLARACAGRSTLFPVFLQVNASGEAAKAGVNPDEIAIRLATIAQTGVLTAVGLMTMAEEGVPEPRIRATFRRLSDLADAHGLPRRSMGMSQDFMIAVEEGATDIRIGTRLFA